MAAAKKIRVPKPVTIDFETFAIQRRPEYPPRPVGVSIKKPGRKSKYYAFGHPTENNCTEDEARKALAAVWNHKDGLLFQNGKFDLDVAETHWGLKPPSADRLHDTMILLFLDDPNQRSVGLKESAERLLDMPPDEQDEVKDWIIENQPAPELRINPETGKIAKIGAGKNSNHPYGAYIAYAPGKLVGKYAEGDTDRTEAIFLHLYESVISRGMGPAYTREMSLLLILLQMERFGVPVDLERLRSDVAMYDAVLQKIEAWLRKKLKITDPDFNFDSAAELAEVLIANGKADPDMMGYTKTGKVQMNKEAVERGVTDHQIAAVMTYSAQLKTCLKTFMRPWLNTAERSFGWIYTTWNQVKSESGVGTRTGRLSSTPNFQNMPKEFKPLFRHQVSDKVEAKKYPLSPIKDLPDLPLCRGYIAPPADLILIGRDYCFTPDTEILTKDRGFVKFPDLIKGEKVATWRNGIMDYDVPDAYQIFEFNGDLVHVDGQRSSDLMMTPNHNCLLFEPNGRPVIVKAEDYGKNRALRQFNAAVLPGSVHVNESVITLVAAIQADASVEANRVTWSLKKKRKISRLIKTLEDLGIEHTTVPYDSKPGFVTIRAGRDDIQAHVDQFLDMENGKVFRRSTWLDVQAEDRVKFLHELRLWDGSAKGGDYAQWKYTSTSIENAEIVQELAAVSGIRANIAFSTTRMGKPFAVVSMSHHVACWASSIPVKRVPYSGKVYCVTMPAHTIMVRRNGKISLTSQSQQEPRILAHFDGADIQQQYMANAWMDYHDTAKELLDERFGKDFARKDVKNTNLGIIYGMGVPKLAERNNATVEETKELKNALYALYPGLKDMYDIMKAKARSGEPFYTWGGRECFCEPDFIDPRNGRRIKFDYKMVNSLIQGSAADCTKEAIVRFYHGFPVESYVGQMKLAYKVEPDKHEMNRIMKAKRKPDWHVLLNVHDELVILCPAKDAEEAMFYLKCCMESVEFDVPILSEGDMSRESWAKMVDYDKKGQILLPF